MKKIYKLRFTLALLVAMLMGAANMQAAEYNLWICGVRVTDANKDNLVAAINNVSGCSATGSIKFIPETNTLAFDNGVVNINADIIEGIKSYISGLNITLKGSNNAVNTNRVQGNGIALYGSATFRSSGNEFATLTVNANESNSNAIVLTDGSYGIYECAINANGSSKGIIASRISTYTDLTIGGADVTAKGTEGCIYGFDIITLDHSVISEPAGAKISQDKSSIVDASGNIIKSTVKITRSGVTTYPILIAGKSITNVNKDKIGELFDGVTGTVTYNPDNKTLKLDDAAITTTGSVCCILSRVDGMIIEVYRTNTLTGNGWSPIAYEDNNSGTIQGSGTLNLSNANPNDGAIFMRNGSLTIKNCTINASGGKNVIRGGSGEKNLIFEKAAVTASLNANGAKEGTIMGFKVISLNNCRITEPAGAVFNASKKAICDASGNIIKGTVKIVPGLLYDLKICGVQVTSLNKNNLSVIPGVTGTATYNPDTKTLTLNGAGINKPDGANAIISDIEGLTIEVINNNSVNSDGWATLRLNKSGTIKGSGTLNVSHSKDGWALLTHNSSLVVENCTLNVTSTSGRAITGNDVGTLTINNATVTAKGANGSITHFAGINFNGVAVEEPIGGIVSKGADTFYALRYVNNGTIITETVKIKPATVYDLYICGVQVTSLIWNKLSNIPGVTAGTVSARFDGFGKVLTLNEVTMSSSNTTCCILSRVDGMIIEVIGTNTLSGNGYSPIVFDGNNSGTIEGSGTLNITNNATTGEGIYMKNGSLTIKDCQVNVISGKHGIFGSSGEKTLTFDKATVSATGTNNGSIIGFKEINLNNCYISQPANAVFNSTQKAICYANGTIVKEKVKIEPFYNYDLRICGVQVNTLNKDNLSVINGVEGKVSYNPVTNTLRLENATINTQDQYGIVNEILNMKIELIGTNTITCFGTAIHINQYYGYTNSYIEGNGTLNVTSDMGNAIEVYPQVTLFIKNSTVNATGSSGINSNGGKLIIENATVKAKGTHRGSIAGFQEIKLIGCTITKPVGAVFNATQKAICHADGTVVVNEEVKIEPIISYDLKICGTQVTNSNKNDLSVISGITGKASYNSDTRTLRLENAAINSTTTGITTEKGGVKIELVGNNTVKSSSTAIFFNNTNGQAPGSIEGSGTLNVTSANEVAIKTNVPLTIKNTLTAKGKSIGISGGGSGKLTVDYTNVSATGTDNGSITGFAEITLTDCSISQPAGAVFNGTKKAICYADGTIVKEEVKIAKATSYDLYICGARVTSINKNNLSSIAGVTGKASYNPDTKILKLDGATITATGSSNAILYKKGGVKIELVGKNTITSSASAILFDKTNGQEPGSIKGSGTLNINSTNGTAIDIAVPLTIENCTVTATGKLSGIAGIGGSITFINTTLSATGTDNGSIIRFYQMSFSDCTIIRPQNAQYNGFLGAICYADGNIIKETVVIAPKGTGIDELNTPVITLYPNPVQDILHIQSDETVNAASIFNLQGKTVAETIGNVREINLAHLPAGIYMVRVVVGESVSTARIIKQ